MKKLKSYMNIQKNYFKTTNITLKNNLSKRDKCNSIWIRFIQTLLAKNKNSKEINKE